MLAFGRAVLTGTDGQGVEGYALEIAVQPTGIPFLTHAATPCSILLKIKTARRVGTNLVGAGLAREGGLETAKSFAGKPASYRVAVFSGPRPNPRAGFTQLLYRSMIALTAWVLTLDASLRACSILAR